jgi:hypothetical protein
MKKTISLLFVVTAIAGCGGPDPKLVELRLATLACRDGVKGQLKTPEGAVFAMNDDARRVDDTTIQVNSWVEAKNDFGITTRRRFTCTASVNAGTAKVEELDLQD